MTDDQAGESQQDLPAELRAVALTIDEWLNGEDRLTERSKWGFIVLCFPFGDRPGRVSYMSNADRSDVIRLLRQHVEHLESTPGEPGHQST